MTRRLFAALILVAASISLHGQEAASATARATARILPRPEAVTLRMPDTGTAGVYEAGKVSNVRIAATIEITNVAQRSEGASGQRQHLVVLHNN